MLRKIVLYGSLAKKYGKEFKFDVKSVGEALKALDANFPGFLRSIERKGEYHVTVGDDLYNGDSLDHNTVAMQFAKGDIHISPLIQGAKKGGVLNVILGAVLIIIGVVMSVYTSGAGTPLIKLGAGMMLSGVAMMLVPTPNTGGYDDRERPDGKKSFMFDGPINTTEQGGPIPVVYGRVLMGSTVISAAMDVEDV
jgi:predicted phage tail protein